MKRQPRDPDPDPAEVRLRDVAEADLALFFEHQRDPAANRMAAFPARDRGAFMAHWREKVLGDDAVVKQTVLFRDQVAGHVVCYEQDGRRLVGYWLGSPFWGRGVATRALTKFVAQVEARPLVAHAARENVGSIRVLEKCGFTRSGEGRGADGVEELVFTLASGPGRDTGRDPDAKGSRGSSGSRG